MGKEYKMSTNSSKHKISSENIGYLLMYFYTVCINNMKFQLVAAILTDILEVGQKHGVGVRTMLVYPIASNIWNYLSQPT